MNRISFAGHESFVCKQFWLKKGYDFTLDPENSFNRDQAVVSLGVGKNMVRAIRFWLKAFGITNEDDELQEIGSFLLSNKNGKDPYLESIGSIWLLHYLLVATEKASIYHLVFNEFRRTRPEFRTEQLDSYIARYCDKNESKAYNNNTVKRDINVLLKSYLPPSVKKRSDIEDSFSGLLYELRLIQQVEKEDILKDEIVKYYSISGDYRDSLPFEIVLYSILDNPLFGNSISFRDLYSGKNSPGNVFALNQEGLFQKIQQICNYFPECSFSETAGNRVLQISKKLDKFAILNEYYKR